MKKYFVQRRRNPKKLIEQLQDKYGEENLPYLIFYCSGGQRFNSGFSYDGNRDTGTYSGKRSYWHRINTCLFRIEDAAEAVLDSPDILKESEEEIAKQMIKAMKPVAKHVCGLDLSNVQCVKLYDIWTAYEGVDYDTQVAKAASILYKDEYVRVLTTIPGDPKAFAYSGTTLYYAYVCKKSIQHAVQKDFDDLVKAATEYLLSTVPTETIDEVPSSAIKTVIFDIEANLGLETFMAKQLGCSPTDIQLVPMK